MGGYTRISAHNASLRIFPKPDPEAAAVRAAVKQYKTSIKLAYSGITRCLKKNAYKSTDNKQENRLRRSYQQMFGHACSCSRHQPNYLSS